MDRHELAVPAILVGTAAALAYEAWALAADGETISEGFWRLQRSRSLRTALFAFWMWLTGHLFFGGRAVRRPVT